MNTKLQKFVQTYKMSFTISSIIFVVSLFLFIASIFLHQELFFIPLTLYAFAVFYLFNPLLQPLSNGLEVFSFPLLMVAVIAVVSALVWLSIGIIIQTLYFVLKSKRSIVFKMMCVGIVVIAVLAYFPKPAGYRTYEYKQNNRFVKEKHCNCIGYMFKDPGSLPPGYWQGICYGLPLQCTKEQLTAGEN